VFCEFINPVDARNDRQCEVEPEHRSIRDAVFDNKTACSAGQTY
jgi:hypothetical protein